MCGSIRFLLFLATAACFASALIHGARLKRSSHNPCCQPPKSGPCLALFIRYYYDKTSDTCNKFVYGGCRGNDNNFETGEECEEVCGGEIVDSDDDDAPVFPEPNDNICYDPAEPGPCYGAFPRYYFNGEKCEKFIYGGCGGNENNFETKEECIERCGVDDEDEDEDDEDEEDST